MLLNRKRDVESIWVFKLVKRELVILVWINQNNLPDSMHYTFFHWSSQTLHKIEQGGGWRQEEETLVQNTHLAPVCWELQEILICCRLILDRQEWNIPFPPCCPRGWVKQGFPSLRLKKEAWTVLFGLIHQIETHPLGEDPSSLLVHFEQTGAYDSHTAPQEEAGFGNVMR